MPKENTLQVEDALAVRYRPRVLTDIIGNSSTINSIKGLFKSRKLPKTWMLSGITGSGKTTTARIIAMTVNCHNLQGIDPCMECPSCIQFLSGAHPDIAELNAGGEQGKIDEVRKMLELSKLAPRHNYRVFIVDEAHNATGKSKGELLKPLEEPNKKVIWILCTSQPEKFPKDLYGRCLKLFFNYPLPIDLAKRLQTITKTEYNKKVYLQIKPFLKEIVEGCGCQPRNSIATLELIVASIQGREGKISEEEIKSIVKEQIFRAGNLDAYIIKFLAHLFLKKKLEPLRIVSELEDNQYEEFITLMYRYSYYAVMYLLFKKKGETFNRRQFWGVNTMRWEATLDKIASKINEDIPLSMCAAITAGTEKIRLGLIPPQQCMLFIINNYMKESV